MVIPLALAAIIAAFDWFAVATDRAPWERVAKPAVMIVLFTAHAAGGQLDSGAWGWLAAGLVFSLVGDVALLASDRYFEVGLGAFLLAHIAYVITYTQEGLSTSWLVVGIVAATLLAGLIGSRLVRAAAADHGWPLGAAVAVYVVALGAMAAFGLGTTVVLLAIGGGLFMASDALLGWAKFVGPAPGGRTAVHATYHAAQFAIVAGVVR